MTFCIIGQWALAVGSSILQGWDALVITVWIMLCAVFVTYVYPPEKATSDWLRCHCGLELVRIRAVFTSRHPMLAALVCINPDRNEVNWMKDLLADSEERSEWLATLFELIDKGKVSEKYKGASWLPNLREGVCMGETISAEIVKIGAEGPKVKEC
ncbi:hypothetical protein F4806DRAFT_496311 [Annulohypoxylon nitens]|nr:hypothetical protein F4806DRAFT_496311 [Annulohypoxylon nitens]